MARSAEPEVIVNGQRVVIQNNHAEKLVGVLHKTGSNKLVILCHGFRSSKNDSILASIANSLVREGISAFRFDFAGNGESEGEFQYGNYWREADDLRSVVYYFSEQKYEIIAIVGHSKGGNAVLLYASKYHDVPIVINISGRFDLNRGMEGRLGKGFFQRIINSGFIDVKDKAGNIEYRVKLDSLMDRLNTDMLAVSRSIDKDCRVLTIHGSEDELVPVEDAYEFAKLISNHKLQIFDGANHRYTAHLQNLISHVLLFIKDNHPTRGNGVPMSRL